MTYPPAARRLASEWSDRNEIVQPIIRQILQQRGAVSLSAGVNEQRVTISWQLRNQSGRRCTARAGMVLYCHRLAP
jgi:hypothetical protein